MLVDAVLLILVLVLLAFQENKRLLGFLAKTPVGNMRETIRAKLECSGSRNEKLSSQVVCSCLRFS